MIGLCLVMMLALARLGLLTVCLGSLLARCASAYESAQTARTDEFCPSFGRLSTSRFDASKDKAPACVRGLELLFVPQPSPPLVGDDRRTMYVRAADGQVLTVQRRIAVGADHLRDWHSHQEFRRVYRLVCGGAPPFLTEIPLVKDRLNEAVRLKYLREKKIERLVSAMERFPEPEALTTKVEEVERLAGLLKRKREEASDIKVEFFRLVGDIVIRQEASMVVRGHVVGDKGTVFANTVFTVQGYNSKHILYGRTFNGFDYLAFRLTDPMVFTSQPPNVEASKAKKHRDELRQLEEKKKAIEDDLALSRSAAVAADRAFQEAKTVDGQYRRIVQEIDGGDGVASIRTLFDIQSLEDVAAKLEDCRETAFCRWALSDK